MFPTTTSPGQPRPHRNSVHAVSGADRDPGDVAPTSDDLYEALRVPSDVSAEDLSSAYRRLAREHHPVSNPDARAGDFQALDDAFEILRDPVRRRQYDATRRHRRTAAEDATGFRIPVQRHSPPGAPAVEQLPEQIELPLTFEQAALGSTATVEVPTTATCASCRGTGRAPARPCGSCSGAGHTVRQSGGINIRRSCDDCDGTGTQPPEPCPGCAGRGRARQIHDLKVRVPPGTHDGAVLRFTVPDQPPREVRAVARVTPHPYFERHDDDVALRLPVTIAEAALGAVVTVPTLRGAVAMRIPPGTPSGRTFRIRGRGIQTGVEAGDLLVTVDVVVPTELSEQQRTGLEAFAAATPSPRAHLEGAETAPPSREDDEAS